MVTASDDAGQGVDSAAGDRAGENCALLVDPAAIDPASWVRVVLHAPHPDASNVRRGPAGARFGQVASMTGPAPRGGIPADRILRMPDAPMQVMRVPQALASVAVPRRRRWRFAMGGIGRRRGPATWAALLVAGLVGAWGAFFGANGHTDGAPPGGPAVDQTRNP